MTVQQYVIDNVGNEILTDIQADVSHIAVGDDNTTPTTSDTSLGNETYRESFRNEEIINHKLFTEIFMDISENNGNNIREAGVFNAASGGDMFSRSLTNELSKTSTREVFVQIDIFVTAVNI